MRVNFSLMKKILIDSHILLWIFADPNKLKNKHIDLIENPAVDVIVSNASLWELHIKASLGKLTIPENFFQEMKSNLISILPVHSPHLKTLLHLPFHHGDPFDRMIISQALSENIPIISYDQTFTGYPVELL